MQPLSKDLLCTNNAPSFPAHLRSIAGSCPRRGQDGCSLSQLLQGGLMGILQHQRLQFLQNSGTSFAPFWHNWLRDSAPEEASLWHRGAGSAARDPSPDCHAALVEEVADAGKS